MFKKNFYVHFVLFAFVFPCMANKCFADVAAQLQQATEYKDNGYYNQAEDLYKKIVSENAGTDNALKAQKGLAFLYLKTEYDVQSNANEQTALDKLTTDFAANPNLPAALYEIADEYSKARKYGKAKALYQEIIQQYPGTLYAGKSQLGIPKTDIIALIESKSDAAAKTAIGKFISYYSQNSYIAEALHDIAYQWRWSKNFEEAIKTYQYVVDHWPNDEYGMWSQMGVAKSNVEAGNFDAAKPALEKLLKNYATHPSLPEALERIAIQYRKANKFTEAKSLYQKIAEISPDSIFGNRAQVKIPAMDILADIVSGNDTAVGTAIDRLLTSFPNNKAIPAVLTDLAAEYEDIAKGSQAKTVYQKIIDHYPDNFRAGKALIEISKGQILEFLNASQDDKVSAEIDRLVATYPKHAFLPDALCQIANGYRRKATQIKGKQGEDYLHKAIWIYEKVINELPASRNLMPQACCSAGECLHMLGEYENSIKYYQKIVDNYPFYDKTWHALFMVGRNYEDMRKAKLISRTESLSKIRAVYKQLLEKYPDCPAAKYAESWLNDKRYR